MSFVKTDDEGAIVHVYHGLRPTQPDDWTEVDGDILRDYDGTAYLISETETPTDGWDKQNDSVGIVQS